MAAPRPLLPCLALLALAASAPVGPHLPTTVEISGSVVEVQRAFQNGLRSVTQTVRALLTDESSAASTATLKDDISTLREGVTGGISKLNESICQVHPPAAPSALRASLEKLEESFNDGLESLNFGADILATIRADKGADKDKEDGSAGGSGGGSGAGGSGSGSGAGGSGSESGSGDKGPFYAFQQFINNFQQTFQENMQNFNNTYQNYITQFSGQGNNTSNSQSSGDSNQNQLIQQIQQIGQNIQNAFGGGQQQQQQQQGQQQQQQQQQQQSDDQSSTTQRPFWQSISQGFQNSIQNIFRPGTSAQAPATAAATTAAADSTTAAPATAAQQTPEQDAPTAPPPGTQRYKGHWGGGHNNAAIGDNRDSNVNGLEEENKLQPTDESSNKAALESEPQSIPEIPFEAISEEESQPAPELPPLIDPEPEPQSPSQTESDLVAQSVAQEEQAVPTAVA